MPSVRLVVFFGLLILSVALALVRGGKPEKAGALIILGMVVLQFASLALKPSVYNEVDVASVVVDGVGAVAFTMLAVHAMRVWPIWAASLQILSLTSHFARNIDSREEPLVYVAMKSGPTFLVIVALLLGTLAHIRRVRINGSDPGWKVW